jgi:hypothetical protein
MTPEAGRFAAIWAALLAITTISGTIVFACMMPFVAVATITALSLPRKIGMAALTACWLGNQVLGFGLMGYPWDLPTFAAGLSLLAASLIAFVIAGRIAPSLSSPWTLPAFAAGFVGYELALAIYALGDLSMFTPEIVALIAWNDAIWFAALWLAWQMLGMAVPGWRKAAEQRSS